MKHNATHSIPARNAPLKGLGTWIILSIIALVPLLAQGQTPIPTHKWIGASGDGNWGTPGNWSPARTVPNVADVLQFDAPATVTNVLTQTISGLVITNGAAVTLQASALGAQTLLINAVNVGDNSLDIGTGASMGFSGTNALHLTLGNHLSVNGSLLFGPSVAQTVTVRGNLSGAGSLNMSAANLAHQLILSGPSNNIATFTSSPTSSSTVHYNAPADQLVFASPNYRNLTISGAGIKTLQGNTTINANAHFLAASLSIGANTLTLNGTLTKAAGSITGGPASSLTIGGLSTPQMYLPAIHGGLLNLTLNKGGANKNVFLGSSLTLFNGGTLHLQDGYFSAGSATNILTIGENPLALVNIIRHMGVLESLPLFPGRVNLTYTATTHDLYAGTGTGPEMPLASTVLNHLTILNSPGWPATVVTLRSSPTVNGTFTLAGSTTTRLALNGQSLTLNGDYFRSGGNFIGSATSSLIVQGHNKNISGTLNFEQTLSATANNRALQNLTLNLSGTSTNLVLDSHCEITNLTLSSGTLTATGADLTVSTASIGANARLVNNTSAFPLLLPGTANNATRAFNNTNLALVNKFDRLTASNHAGNAITANATDLSFSRAGLGELYAVRTRDLNPAPTAAIVTFQLAATNNGTSVDNAASLSIGDNLGDDPSQPGGAARLQFNLSAANNFVTVTNGTNQPSTTANAGQTFTWVINRSGSAVKYTTPSGGTQNALANNSGDLWLGTAFLGNATFNTSSFGEVKFVMNEGLGSIRLINLRINPIATIVTNAFANTCITPGSIITVPYSINEAPFMNGSVAGGLAQSMNTGSQVRVQLSNELGAFDPNYYNNTALTPISLTNANALLLNGSIQVQLPIWATAPGYRYRVVVSELPNDTRPNAISTSQPLYTAGQATSLYFVSPSAPQSFVINATGAALTVTTPTAGSSYQWFYQRSDDLTNTKVPITGATLASYTPKGIDFGSEGTYNVFCRVTFGGCTAVETNQVPIDVICGSGTNVIANGDFNNYLTGNAHNVVITPGTAKVTGNGTRFTTQLRPGRKLYTQNNLYLGTILYIEDDDELYLDMTKLYGNPITDNSTRFRVNFTEISLQGTITTSGTTVTGTNTQFHGQLQPGYSLYRNDGAFIGIISTIISSTQLTLQAPAAVALTNSIFKTDADDFLYPGTISASTSSKVVTGINTTFDSRGHASGAIRQIEPGDIIRIIDRTNGSTIVDLGEVEFVDGPTSVRLKNNSKATVSNASYVANPKSFGNTGMQFDTQYRYSSWDLDPVGNYAVADNPNYYDADFCSMTANTQRSSSIGGSGGNMLIGNAGSSTQMIWSQFLQTNGNGVIGVEANTNYVLSFSVTSLSGTNSTAKLAFGAFINCSRVGEDITQDYATKCNWTRYTILLNSGSLSSFTLSIANISALTNGFNDIAIDDISLVKCTSTRLAQNFPSITKFQWRGYSTDWFNADNWGQCGAPSCGENITLPSGLTNYPVINAAGAQAGTIRMYPNSSLTINSGINLDVCGDINNEGTINALNGSRVTFVGPGTLVSTPAATAQQITTNASSPFADVVIAQSQPMSNGVSLLSDVTVNGQLDIRSNNTTTLNNATLTLNGTLANSTGTITGGTTGGLIINGSGDLGAPLLFRSTVTNGQSLAFLKMNRTGNGRVRLGSPLNLAGGRGLAMGVSGDTLRASDGLWLRNGLITTTNSQLLTLNAAATVAKGNPFISGGSNSSYIDGPMGKVSTATTNFTFPVGNAGFLGEIGINPDANTQTTYVARYIRKSAYTIGYEVQKPPLDHVSQMEHWTLDRPTVGGAGGRVTLHWTGYSIVSKLSTQWKELRVARHTGASTGITPLNLASWVNQGPGAEINTNTVVSLGANYEGGYVTSDAVTGFGYFTLASTIPNNPLPVELVSLKATPTQDGKVNLTWITASEHHTSHFLLQHSTDGRHFRTIGQVQAQGESVSAQTYSFLHNSPAPFNYYRLSIVDQDASSRLSSLVTAQLQGTALSAPLLYPNPSDGKHLFVKTSYSEKVTVSIISLVGVEVFRQRIQPQQGLLSLRPNLPQGTYLVSLKEGNLTTHVKLIVE